MGTIRISEAHKMVGFRCASWTKAGAPSVCGLQPLYEVEYFLSYAQPTTYMYFLVPPGPPVCWCIATENPKKLPLVFPSLITGNRSSMLNPLQVCVLWYTTKITQINNLGDMFRLFFPPRCSRLPPLIHGTFPQWAPTGRLLLHRDLRIKSRPSPSQSQCELPRCLCLPPSFYRPPLQSMSYSLPPPTFSTTLWTYSVVSGVKMQSLTFYPSLFLSLFYTRTFMAVAVN